MHLNSLQKQNRDKKIPEKKRFLDLKPLAAAAILERMTRALFGNTAEHLFSAGALGTRSWTRMHERHGGTTSKRSAVLSVLRVFENVYE